MPVTQDQLNAGYEDAIHVLKTKPPKVESKPDSSTSQEDYYRRFRTKWVFLVSFFLGGSLNGYYYYYLVYVMKFWVVGERSC